MAIPSILQQGFVSVGNLFIQYLVNGFGSSVIAGYSAAIKLNTFAITSCTTLGSGISSFTAQNLGAGKPDRIRSGFRTGALFSVIVSVAFSLVFCFLGSPLLRLFMNQDSTALAMDTGLLFLRIVAPFYCVVAVKISCDSVLRGGECMQYFMITTFLDLALRVILAFVFSPCGSRPASGWHGPSAGLCPLYCPWYFTGCGLGKSGCMGENGSGRPARRIDFKGKEDNIWMQLQKHDCRIRPSCK